MEKYREFFKEKGLEVEIIRPEPGDKDKQWMHNLVQKFYIVAVDAFGRWLPYSAIDSRTRVSDLIISITDKRKEVVGYGVNELLELDGLTTNYFASGFTKRQYQDKGIYSKMNKMRMESFPQAECIMTRTQNPVIYKKFVELGKKYGYKVSPNESGISDIARKISKIYCENMKEDMIVEEVYKFVEEGNLGRALMYDTPKPETKIEKCLWEKIRVDNGDGLMIVGHR